MASEKIIEVPDIGGYKDVEIIEILVAIGDSIKAEDSLITLESDKAAMEIPSPYAGKVVALAVKLGDKVSQGSAILTLTLEETGAPAAAETIKPATAPVSEIAAAETPKTPETIAARPEPVAQAPVQEAGAAVTKGRIPHASPAVRAFARELGADVGLINGSGPKRRILKQDVQSYIKARLQSAERSGGSGVGLNFPALPDIDYSRFGPVRAQALSNIKKLSGANLHRNWVGIPHVTHHEEADITELEAFRRSIKGEAEKQGVNVTLLPLLIKALIVTLKAYPSFNSSLGNNGTELILKDYFHIGVAVDTPDGLVVPVLRDADRKGVFELASTLTDFGQRARARKLKTTEMQGGTFTISSLGGIGGVGFTPIINAPEVAILGVCRAQTRPVWQDGAWAPRLMLPLSLSYDHRVIDGAEAARFCALLARTLGDIRRVLL
ncbi:dihydrolipoyllysine-residue acetyltransferase [Candidatus Methylospira mobilis]|uniref:Dihydrolipoamide acetyltransferase component of pyruvate dehydrogenase complex n=1 Tax=Candidatus Methylospira mobilis TaxID=1808979 RepID=A0A5Q0BHD5_9GAMM|nr:dihydrolipoyllysine-residue acetyltransferase [Candidatus Methylospira mobilis]QFY41538.1 dihydrolipoyllysine-residue acetyltransferase [Candidatus Methylospira mobilis]WNV05224.1 dihydrolipoyllysine-residue acetyltransferase [Candidatus Methylospira mobilis]